MRCEKEKINKNESVTHTNGAVHSCQNLDSTSSRRRVASYPAPNCLYILPSLVAKNEEICLTKSNKRERKREKEKESEKTWIEGWKKVRLRD